MSDFATGFFARLPYLLELADELGIPIEVRPDIHRAGPPEDRVVVSAQVTLHANIGEPGPTLDLGRGLAERLDGSWLQIVGEQDLRLVAQLRRHRIIDGDTPAENS